MTRALLVLALALAGLLAGCAPTDSAGRQRDGSTVTVLAAASLTDVLTSLAERFETEHPGVRVRLGFAGSTQLAAQILAGAPADVFVAADRATMREVSTAGALAARPVLVARNHLVVAVPQGNPGNVRGIADLARADLAVALCSPEVPCGAAAQTALERAGVRASVDTYEQDVRATLTKVELGEVDVALVYRTDVRSAAARVTGIALPTGADVTNDYLAAALADAPNPDLAQQLVALLRSPDGRRALAGAGFEVP